MATSRERKEIAKLQLAGDSVWKKSPTTINRPQNPTRTPPSGSNPFGQVQARAPPKAQRSSAGGVGNPTSRQTLLGREPREPPNKRQKMSHGGDGFGGNRTMSRVLREPEPEIILVDGDAEEEQLKRSSKYLFKADSRRNGKQAIIPSGKNTAILDNYKDVPSPQVDLTADSDIESFSDAPIPPSDPRLQGHRNDTGPKVKKLVEKYEGKLDPPKAKPASPPPRLDLRTVPRGKSRMQKKFEPFKSPGTQTVRPSTIPKGLDPIATSSSLKPSPKPPLKSLPVKDAFIDAQYHDGAEFQIFVTCEEKKGLFMLKQQDDSTGRLVILFEIPPERNPNLQFKYGSTILQFCTERRLVTIRTQAADPGWSQGDKDNVTNFMRGLEAQISCVSKEEALWATAEQHKSALLLEDPSPEEVQSRPTTSARIDELNAIQERKRKNPVRDLFNAKREESQPKSVSVTPAVPSTAVPANDRKNTTRSSKKNDTQLSEATTVVRRSTRNKEHESASDADEVILVYPPGAPGAVTITKGDFARLEPDQYLNDTLIEFALKLWMTRLEQERPDIAQQVHVFSSFFYKKLNSKRDMRQAYENVRKWTSKFDIFKKKYIIVPINEHYHWYLAIIYEPEHMLSETAPEKPTARKATRLATKAVEAELADALMESEESVKPTEETGGRPSVEVEGNKTGNESAEKEHSVGEDIPQTSSEGEVERDLSGFDESVRIEDPELEEPSSKTGARSPSPALSYVPEVTMEVSKSRAATRSPSPATLSYVSEKAMAVTKPTTAARSHSPATLSYVSESAMHVSKSRAVSPSASDFGRTIPRSRRASNASSNVNMSDPDEMLLHSGDVPIELLSEENVALLDSSGPQADMDPGSPIAVSEVAAASHGGAIPSKRFYQSITKTEKGKQKAKSKREVFSVDDDNAQDVDMDVDMKPRTVIFTLDSLGTSHRAAITKLTAYLQREAADKKGIENPGHAAGKQASVPAQPNFCDCGLYLIHFAQTFISDPIKYYKLSMAPKGKLHNKDAKEDWNDKKVQTMRVDLAQEIINQSVEWLKTRPVKPEKDDDESDGEIAILSQNPVSKPKTTTSQKPGVSRKPGVSQKAVAPQKPVVPQKPVDPKPEPVDSVISGPADRIR